ncbi:hypothetical protein PG995_011734 [Apiospora arundinis]|uniref:Transposase n=1 Tax=Apiospora arundinis TaxID=335852 RepID=A0ABR2HLK5_9PEZI
MRVAACKQQASAAKPAKHVQVYHYPAQLAIWMAADCHWPSTVYYAAICDLDRRGVRITNYEMEARLDWRRRREGRRKDGNMMRYRPY